MFIIQLSNRNFALMQSNLQCNPTFIAECESYDAATEIKNEMEE